MPASPSIFLDLFLQQECLAPAGVLCLSVLAPEGLSVKAAPKMIQDEQIWRTFCCRVDFHTQEHDPSAKDSHEDSQKLQEAVAQIFNVNGADELTAIMTIIEICDDSKSPPLGLIDILCVGAVDYLVIARLRGKQMWSPGSGKLCA